MYRPGMRVWTGVLVLTGMLTLTGPGQPAQAAVPGNARSSLKMAPANVAFYSASLRNREQLEAITNSRAWAKLMSVPAVKQYLAMVETELKNNKELAEFKKHLEAPENKELVDLLTEMVSDEVFTVGGDNWSDLLQLITHINNARYSPFLELVQGKVRPDELGEAQTKAVLDALLENSKLAKLPDTVFGFRVADPKKAQNQLKRLETLLDNLVEIVPPLRGKYSKKQIRGSSFLSLSFDGTLIPLKELKLEQSGLEKDQIAKLVRILTDLKLSINLGVQGNYLLLNIGGSTKLLGSSLGAGGGGRFAGLTGRNLPRC